MEKGAFIIDKKIEWLTDSPIFSANRVAIVVPQYNEACNYKLFIDRLYYYKRLSQTWGEEMDIILVDDGSTDGSSEIILDFLEKNYNCFYYAKVSPNTNKVGALYLTTMNINHSYVLFSDFDTDLEGLQNIRETCDILDLDHKYMGCYFRMSPMEEGSWINSYQIVEYALLRTLYKVHSKDQSISVMPGAGSIYKRRIINEIFSQHTGLRSGEDRESAIIGQRFGYKTFYQDKLNVITRPPSNYSALVKQRIRWNLGYIETLYYQRPFYIDNIKRMTPFGCRTMYDIINIFSILVIFPLLIFSFFYMKFVMYILISYFFIKILWLTILLSWGKMEVKSIKNITGKIIFYPIIRMAIEIPSWIISTAKFLKNIRSRRKKTEKQHYKILTEI